MDEFFISTVWLITEKTEILEFFWISFPGFANGLESDELKKGISAKEILHRFWDTDVRLEWELTIETCKVCEV